MISRFSSLKKMQRVLEYCFRFARRRNIPKNSGPITRMEYDRALNAAILCKQLTYPYNQIKYHDSTPIMIAQLAPFFDEK